MSELIESSQQNVEKQIHLLILTATRPPNGRLAVVAEFGEVTMISGIVVQTVMLPAVYLSDVELASELPTKKLPSLIDMQAGIRDLLHKIRKDRKLIGDNLIVDNKT